MNLPVTDALNVLLIEDDADDYVLAKELLLKGAPEYQLHWVKSKSDALAKLRKQTYDIILCDFHLGGDSGDTVIQALRDKHIETPVIFLTGQGTDELSKRAIQLGADDYLEKSEVTPLALKKSIYYTLERRRHQRDLLDSQLTFEYLLEDSLQPVVLVDDKRMIIYANPSAEKLLQQTSAELKGRRLPIEYNDNYAFSHEAALNMPDGKKKRIRHYSIQTHWRGQPVRLVHFEDITNQVELEQKVAFFANHDSLTGLPNRVLLADRLQQSMTLCKRNDVQLGVVFVGLDGFKAVNDTMGHKIGDRLLLAAAERLKDCLRPGDTLARMEGDEFVAVLSELRRQSDAAFIADRLIEAMQRPFHIESSELHLSASAGIAVTESYDDDPLKLVQQADIAMYEAKRQGHGTYQWFDQQLNQQLTQSLRIRNSLQSGIDKQEFELHYQPQFYLSHGDEITGVEALIRWNHPELGMVPPGDFIEVAENTGQIVQLSRWILMRACHDFLIFSAERDSLTTVSVNISTVHILRTEFVDTVREVIKETGIKPSQLVLEITESVFMRHPELAINKLHELRELGVKVALDDFGTGYSSLSYLKSLPVNLLKIDRSFVSDMVSNRHDSAIIEGIISMAHHLELEVLAEGVETSAQQEYLRRCHCDAIQGFLLAKPLPKDALIKFLHEYRGTVGKELKDANSQTVLIVDDEENVLKSLKRLLRRDGYEIYTAGSADEAFDVLAHNAVDVVISDQRMRNMQGLEFLSNVRSMYPNTARIVLTAYRNEDNLTQAINESEVYRFLDKPWDDEVLRQTVRNSMRPRQESNLRPFT
ncbi:EAL domain-containing protein [Idiomarina sp. HP20-50]|uniref:EAL domain-containing protein n=1 Tax=Idiomarina sp. HP20-50 TaxID=3070813 RepID=UPI003982C056